jgi:sulfite reductase (NADPH) flavoprotein alpha-component
MLEELLLAQGAVKTSGRVECDLDYEPAAELWSAGVIEYSRLNLNPAPATVPETAGQTHLSVVPAVSGWNRKNPFAATVERIQKITGLESGKDVYHLELSLEDSGLRYQPGDSLGVWAPNDPETVAELLRLLGLDPTARIDDSGDISDIEGLLTDRLELTRLSADVVRSYAKFTEGRALETHFDRLDETGRRAFIESRQFIDLVQEYPARLAAGDLAAMLRPLAPRSYSIASSQDLVDEDVHLTVASLYSDALGIRRTGVASGHLNRRLQAGDELRVFLEPNRRFRLPEDRGKPLILIAAGTGVAPYRAFLQQLEHENAATDTWLIYGNPNLRTDFLYQREWLNWRSTGLLTRIDCAWSRDQQEKRYVQHLVAEHIEELVRWLDRGTSVYLCGGLAMGQAVEQALRDGLAGFRGIDTDAAASEIAALRRDGRLLKDLY